MQFGVDYQKNIKLYDYKKWRLIVHRSGFRGKGGGVKVALLHYVNIGLGKRAGLDFYVSCSLCFSCDTGNL